MKFLQVPLHSLCIARFIQSLFAVRFSFRSALDQFCYFRIKITPLLFYQLVKIFDYVVFLLLTGERKELDRFRRIIKEKYFIIYQSCIAAIFLKALNNSQLTRLHTGASNYPKSTVSTQYSAGVSTRRRQLPALATRLAPVTTLVHETSFVHRDVGKLLLAQETCWEESRYIYIF